MILTYAQAQQPDNEIIANLPKPKREQLTKMLEYINSLARATGTKIDEWDLFDVFKSKHDKPFYDNFPAIYTDNLDLRKKFFLKRAKDEEDKNKEINKRLTPDVISRLNNALGKNFASPYKKELDKYNKFQDTVVARLYSLEVAQGWLRTSKTKLDALKGVTSTSIEDQMRIILKDGRTEFLSVSNGKLNLATTYDCILRHQTAKKEYVVNLGRFRISIKLDNWDIKILEHKNNLFAGGLIHSHITKDGYICWGQVDREKHKYIRENNLLGVIDSIHMLLASYYHTDTYRSIQSLSEEQERNKHLFELKKKFKDDLLLPKSIADIKGVITCRACKRKEILPLSQIQCRKCGNYNDYEDYTALMNIRGNKESIRILGEKLGNYYYYFFMEMERHPEKFKQINTFMSDKQKFAEAYKIGFTPQLCNDFYGEAIHREKDLIEMDKAIHQEDCKYCVRMIDRDYVAFGLKDEIKKKVEQVKVKPFTTTNGENRVTNFAGTTTTGTDTPTPF